MTDSDQERIAVLETQNGSVLVKVEDLHADMIARRARWKFISSGVKYGIWIAGAIATLFGFKSANWLGIFPHEG